MKFADKVERRTNRVALVVDIRGRIFEALSSSLDTLKDMKVDFEIVFMDATDETLIRRYKESRRSHPLAPNGLITTGLKKNAKFLTLCAIKQILLLIPLI